MPGIPQNILDEILEATDIVQVISGHVPLKKTGRNYKANCPFHHEKTPSFVVSPDKQIYHCFGCGAGGNAFNFLMKYDRMEFLDAVRLLAKKAGVALPAVKKVSTGEASLIEKLARANELAAAFYTNNLLNNDLEKPASEYIEKRNISKNSIIKFKLGYSLNAWDRLIEYARQKGIGADILSKAGLALKSTRDGSFYDRFRNRLIFPVFDAKGKVIAFGARVLDDSLPKYVNSPETPLYTKGKHLYGLNFAKQAIARANFVVMVEGYMDLISLSQAGIENVVASCGTALTPEQSRLLKRFTTDVVMIFDGDQAGETATLRNLDILIAEGFNARVVSLPSGYDPDSFVTKFGLDEFKKVIEQAKDLFSYKLGLLLKRYKSGTPEGKAKIVSEMLPTLWRIPNAVLKSTYLRKLSEGLDIDEAALREELGKVRGDYTYYYKRDAAQPDTSRMLKSAEKILLSLMLEDCSLIEGVRSKLDYGIFQDEVIRKIVKIMYDFCDGAKKITPGRLITFLDDETSSELISELASDGHRYADKEKNIYDCIRWIKENSRKCRLKDLQTEIHSAQTNGDQLRLKELVAQYSELLRSDKVW